MRILPNLIIVLFSLSPIYIYSQSDYFYEEILTLEEPGMWSQFGLNVFLSGEEAAIYGDDGLHCYRLEDSTWYNFQTINEPNAHIYGRYFRFTNEYLVVGAPSSIINYPDDSSGEVYLYKKENEFWVSDTVLIQTDQSIFEFGSNVFIDSNRIAIQAKLGNQFNFNTVVYIFRNNGEHWYEEAIIPSPILSTDFGGSIILSGDSAYISDKNFNHELYGEFVGIVYEYQYENDSWSLRDSIEAANPFEESHFGTDMCMIDNYLFIGAPGVILDNEYPGYVHVFRIVEDNWEEIQLLTASDSDYLDTFGNELDGYGDKLAIGAPGSDDAGNASGSVYIFKLVEMQWQEENKIIPSDSNYGDFFGDALSITENYLLVGACLKNGLEGAVYVYDPHDTTLHANFAGDVRNGNAPVTVQFTSVPQGNPTAYEWDFNSDGFIDSTEPNPQFTYQINGVYTVTLTVYDETGSDSEVKTDYIQVVSDILFGDVDQSGELDVGDLVLYIAFVLGDAEPTEDQFIAGDVNYSGQIDIIDIVMVIHEILN